MHLHSLYYIVLLIGSFFFLKYLSKQKFFFKHVFLLDKDFKKKQSFHKTPALNIGGIYLYFFLFLSYFFFLENNILYNMIVLSLPVFTFSLLEDFKLKINVFFRFFLLTFILIFTIKISNLKIYSIQFYFLDGLLRDNSLFMFFFLVLCFLFIINGANFIDGFNGLLGFHFSIILIFLIYLSSKINDIQILNLCLILFILNSSFLYFNFPTGKIFYGNSGSYLIGFIISFLIIKINEQTLSYKIFPFFFACLLYYLFFEVFFSFFRKLFFEKKNPFLPDKKHLHMLLYNILKSNPKTGIYINIYYLTTLIPLVFFANKGGFIKTYFFFLIIFYILFYSYLQSKKK